MSQKASGSNEVGMTGFYIGCATPSTFALLVPYYGVLTLEFADPTVAKMPIQTHSKELDDLIGFSYLMAIKGLKEESVENFYKTIKDVWGYKVKKAVTSDTSEDTCYLCVTGKFGLTTNMEGVMIN